MRTALIIVAMALVMTGITYAIWYYISHKRPYEPDQPDVPVESDQPEEPTETDTPEEPATPNEPETPSDPDEPESGDQNGTDPVDEPIPGETEPQHSVYDDGVEYCLSHFKDYVLVERDSLTYRYLSILFDEATEQFFFDKSNNGIPTILKKENFPVMYRNETKDLHQEAFYTLVGYLFALQLSSLKPYYRTEIMCAGYSLGGYHKYSDLYGYTSVTDPNNMRIAAGAIWSAMRGVNRPDEDAMRKEVGGSLYDKTLAELRSDKENVLPEGFFIDFREFMPTAPAPYAPGYTSRPDRTYPTEPRDGYDNLEIDREIHEDIITKYNLDNPEYLQATVQAIADKEADREHLFGDNRTTKHYHFHPVFGMDTIGIRLNDSGDLAEFASLALKTSSAARSILQSTSVSPKQYGRLRPGCSWKQEARKNSSSDDRRNVLTNFEIEDGDGSPTGYYDQSGNWVYKESVKSAADFEEQQKNALWANSYPSGHSAGIMGAAMVLIELMPDRADRILRAANQYAVNRTIARYHWTSDTINGRVLGVAQNAVAHAASDYDTLLDKARKELGIS